MRVIAKTFARTAGLILLITAGGKLVSAFGTSMILSTADPVFMMQFRYLLIVASLLELFVATICLFGKNDLQKVSLVAWLATVFACYRFSSSLLGYQRPCPCMGSLTDALHISSQTSDTIMTIVLIYLLTGSYAILAYYIFQHSRIQLADDAPLST